MQQLDTVRITEKLARLRTARPAVFGVEAHGFHLNPRLSEADTSAFEQDHQVILPSDYRQFLNEVGNGGAGPFYGVFLLSQMDDGMSFRHWSQNDGVVGMPSEPFLFNEAWNDLSQMPKPELERLNEADYWAQMALFEKRYWSSTLINGAIPICHKGCALRIWLVVTGMQAGYLWEDRRSQYEGLQPVMLADGSPATFAGWYEHWLDDCLTSLNGTQPSTS